MELDLFTVIAQVVNFVVLVALLKRFLYGPVVRSMDERERKIAARLEEAAEAGNRAEAEAERLRVGNAELEAARDRLLAEARADAEERRRELLRDAREEAQHQRERWREAIEREKEAVLEELERRILERVHAIASRALRDLADRDLEGAIAETFARRLEALDPEDWARALERGADEPRRSLLVASAFPLSTAARTAIETQIRRRVGAEAELSFEVDPDLIAGVELRTHGLRIAWNLRDFVESLEGVFQASGPLAAAEVPR